MSKSCVIYLTTTCQKIRANRFSRRASTFFLPEISIQFLTPLLKLKVPGVIHTS